MEKINSEVNTPIKAKPLSSPVICQGVDKPKRSFCLAPAKPGCASLVILKNLTVPLVMAGCLSYPATSQAALATIPTAGVALASFGVATAGVVAGGAVAKKAVDKNSTGGLVVGAIFGIGGLALGFTDPSAATFYDGSFSIHYDSSLMKVDDAGWLGTWGENPSLLPPPTDTSQWGSAGVTVALQKPNAALAANVSNDAQAGLQTVSFDWGAAGHPGPAEPFNMFGTLFEFTQNVEVTFLADATQPPAGANLFVSTDGFTCTLPGDDLKHVCGEAKTSYYKVTKLPEPGNFILLAIGLGFLGFLRRRGF